MTHFLERSVLVLLATSALGACATPNFPIAHDTPPVQTARALAPPPPAAPSAPISADPAPEPPRAAAPVEARPLDSLPAAAPPAVRAEPTYRTVTTRSVTGRVVEVEGPAATYRVKSGDNLLKIARELSTSVQQLKADNGLKSDVIRPGQELKGPRRAAKAYEVAQGDTLFAIGRRFGVSGQAVAAENDMDLNATLRVGQRLRLPAGYRDQGPITTTTRVAESPAPPVQTAQAPPMAETRPPLTIPPPLGTAPPAATTPPPIRTAPPAASVPPPPPPPVERPAQTATRPAPPPASTPTVTVPGAPVASPPPTDTQVSQLGRGLFIWPVRGEVISGFGPKGAGQRNDGVNIRVGNGDPVRAAAAGDVVYAGDQVPGFGNLVLIKHADGWVTAYGHLARVDVKMQQRVTQGQQIGQAGATGGVGEPQLHFEVRYAPTPEERARPVDPGLVLPRL